MSHSSVVSKMSDGAYIHAKREMITLPVMPESVFGSLIRPVMSGLPLFSRSKVVATSIVRVFSPCSRPSSSRYRNGGTI